MVVGLSPTVQELGAAGVCNGRRNIRQGRCWLANDLVEKLALRVGHTGARSRCTAALTP